MTMSGLESVIIIAIAVMTTVFSRALAFVVFPANRPTPAYIKYLAKVLPSAVFALLVVYCYKDINFVSGMDKAAPALCCGLLVAGLQLWKRNMFLSMLTGTAVYMIWIQSI